MTARSLPSQGQGFKRFLGLDIAQKPPDAKTIWLWRERVKHSGLDKRIFAWFDGELSKAGFEAKGGVSYHGYKNHIGIDAKHKLIREEEATTAGVHCVSQREN